MLPSHMTDAPTTLVRGSGCLREDMHSTVETTLGHDTMMHAAVYLASWVAAGSRPLGWFGILHHYGDE